jgi:hypothetical protein
LISETLDLELVKWDGEYYGVSTIWLRWADRDGTLIPTKRELKEDAIAESNEKIEQIINKLKAIGMNSEQISEITGVPIEDLPTFQVALDPEL